MFDVIVSLSKHHSKWPVREVKKAICMLIHMVYLHDKRSGRKHGYRLRECVRLVMYHFCRYVSLISTDIN